MVLSDLEKATPRAWSGMDKGVELTVTADEVSRSWSSPVKSYGV